MNNLFIALMEKNIKPAQAAKAISNVIQCSDRTARNKINGISDFTISEAVKINEIIFDNKYEIGFLFKRDDEEKAG